MIHVVGTALDATAINPRWSASIREQTTDCAYQFAIGPQAAVANLIDMISPLAPDSIVVWLDCDDYLATPRSLEVIANTYRDHDVWLTYGSFMREDGRVEFAHHWVHHNLEPPRQCPWFATHLKTFRAGLFQKIQRESLMGPYPGPAKWLPQSFDLAIVFPMLEMAGPEHARFIPQVLMVYTGAHFLGETSRAKELECERYVRGQPAYERLKERPW